ncbi:hypothetical protein SLEP1_g16742 [Rubroshorea leprosula]|uniref:MADS-box domain-containing protein n=1 Tax=Rubroshorea leprosula TaxID=152421 RepID=A0AAV5J2E6_9ROSI|nr:hypothetical protein SLEP1_g16742 [Rubroshorea leprosula]
MVRVMLQLKKIENKAYKHITFAKRRSGLVKKAFQLSTLCDVEVALIICSSARNLTLFEGKKSLPNQELRQIISQLNLEVSVYHHNTTSLGYFVKSLGCIKSSCELEYHEKILEDTLQVVRMHKARSMARAARQEVPDANSGQECFLIFRGIQGLIKAPTSIKQMEKMVLKYLLPQVEAASLWSISLAFAWQKAMRQWPHFMIHFILWSSFVMCLSAAIFLVCCQKPTTDGVGVCFIAFAIDLNHPTYVMLGAGFIWMSMWILAVIGTIDYNCIVLELSLDD